MADKKRKDYRVLDTVTKIIFGTVIVVILTAISFLIFRDSSEPDYVNSADGFTIDSYKVILKIKSDNVIEVTEKIVIDWQDSYHHGIYKFTPLWLKYTGKDGKTIRRKANLTEYQAIGENYTLDVVKKKPRIKIGSPYSYVQTGLHTYEISYIYDMGKDPYKNFDEFIFHAFGDYWETAINNASLEITMPSDISDAKISFYNDKYRNIDITSNVDHYISGNTLFAQVKSSLTLYQALTVDIELPEGYFKGGHNNYGIFSLLLCVATIMTALASCFAWFRYGRDYDKVAQTVEFYPPDGLDAAQIALVYNNQVGKKPAIALIIQLAAKGWISINEESKNKPVITNLNSSADQKRNTTLPALSENEQLVYDHLFKEGNSTKLSENQSFYRVFDLLTQQKEIRNKFYDIKSYWMMAITALAVLLNIGMVYLAWWVFEDLDPAYGFLYNLAFVSLFVTIFFTIIMGRRSEYGESIKARVAGFRHFLSTVEKDVLNTLVEENPNYFFDILPYTYVLNLSKKWITKFEDIPLPRTEMGNFDYTDSLSLNSLSNSVYTPPSSSSSGSGCGGGSSCGGGCSSCGGGGSW